MCWTKKTYNAKLDNLAALKAERDALDKKIKEIEDAIKNDLGELETMETGKYLVRFTTYETSRFDTKGFSKHFPDVAEAWTKKTISRRFSFSTI